MALVLDVLYMHRSENERRWQSGNYIKIIPILIFALREWLVVLDLCQVISLTHSTVCISI